MVCHCFLSLAFLVIVAAIVPAGCASTNFMGGKPPFDTPSSFVDPDMAQACVHASANKYYLPTRVIKAVNSQTDSHGMTQIGMQVDLRHAVCTIDAAGKVRSVVDTAAPDAD